LKRLRTAALDQSGRELWPINHFSDHYRRDRCGY